jgi:hypothetical protein
MLSGRQNEFKKKLKMGTKLVGDMSYIGDCP